MIAITPELLRAATGCSADAAARFAPDMAEACERYEINTPKRLAAFLAQLGHESGGLRFVREIASGEAYEGRASLGNTQPGDGVRYKGRGLIQVTGRSNYRAAAQRMQHLDAPDFEDFPEALEEPRWAVFSAADYWHANALNALADSGDFDDISSLINTGRKGRLANGHADRVRRHQIATVAIGAAMRQTGASAANAPAPTPMQPGEPQNAPEAANSAGTSWRPLPGGDHVEQQPENTMPLPAIVGALLPALIESVPKLGKLFGSGSAVAERNVQAATIAMQVAQEAVGAVNAQDAIDRIKSDPAAATAVARAVEQRWLEIAEAGGGGIDGARKNDAAVSSRGDMLQSPSFWIGLALLPLVYMFAGSLIGLVGTATWSDDVRAGLAGSITSAVIGGLVGYYFGQTTSRNRSPAP